MIGVGAARQQMLGERMVRSARDREPERRRTPRAFGEGGIVEREAEPKQQVGHGDAGAGRRAGQVQPASAALVAMAEQIGPGRERFAHLLEAVPADALGEAGLRNHVAP